MQKIPLFSKGNRKGKLTGNRKINFITKLLNVIPLDLGVIWRKFWGFTSIVNNANTKANKQRGTRLENQLLSMSTSYFVNYRYVRTNAYYSIQTGRCYNYFFFIYIFNLQINKVL